MAQFKIKRNVAQLGVMIDPVKVPSSIFDTPNGPRAYVAAVLEDLANATVAPAVNADGRPLSPDIMPEVIKMLTDKKAIGLTLVVTELE